MDEKLLILIGWLLQRPNGLDLPCFKKDMDFKLISEEGTYKVENGKL